jgi:phosphoribosylamine--glycine ligase
MRVLVIGSGGREHALAAALHSDPVVTKVIAAPGNPGMAAVADLRAVDPLDRVAVAKLAVECAVDLVVIGPEAPLAAGVVDAVRAAGVPCFGPSAAAARIEGSKAFAKEVMAASAVPTAASYVCTSVAEAEVALAKFGAPYVVKNDSLAAGKGVVVTDEYDVALRHAASCERVVIEQYLDGPEVSMFVVTDGVTALPLILAKDYKRLGDGDRGPNTGGMGAYAPLTDLPDGLVDDVLERVVTPVLATMVNLGHPFVGVLYVGLALTSSGPMVVEFNSRFGDPEAQVVMPLLKSSPYALFSAAATGTLDTLPPLEWCGKTAVAVVVAAPGYPTNGLSGVVIAGADGPGYFHAGTAVNSEGALVTTGARAICCTALGDSVTQARERAYEMVSRVAFAGAVFRSDIAAPATSP